MPCHYCDELPPQPHIASAEEVGPSDPDTLMNIDNTQTPDPPAALPAFMTDSNTYGVYQVYPSG
jgi:hypothetical protein